MDKGFFKAAGVDITGGISGEGGGSSVRAVIASDLGYGETSPAGIIAAINEGQDIKIVDIGSRSMGGNVLLLLPQPSLQNKADFKRREICDSNTESLGERVAGALAGKSPAKHP